MDPLFTSIVPMAAEQQGNLMNMITAGIQNKANLKYNAKMYQIQRRDALADWQMQNAYNSPAAQMQRLKEAGLNPNLVYGNGATATATQQPRSSNVGAYKAEIPAISYGSVGTSIMNYYDAQVKQAQIDNLKAMRVNRDIETAIKTVQAAKGKLDLQKAQELYQTSIDMQKAQLQKLYADTTNVETRTTFAMDENERRWALQQPKLDNIMQDILLKQERRKLITKQEAQVIANTWKSNEQARILQTQWEKWWSKGSNPNSSVLQDILKKLFDWLVEHFKNNGKPDKGIINQGSDKNNGMSFPGSIIPF